MNDDELFQRISEILCENFELAAEDVRPESKLYEELDLDSIDAVDVFVQIQEITGRRPDPEVAKEIRTVAELVAFAKAELARDD